MGGSYPSLYIVFGGVCKWSCSDPGRVLVVRGTLASNDFRTIGATWGELVVCASSMKLISFIIKY